MFYRLVFTHSFVVILVNSYLISFWKYERWLSVMELEFIVGKWLSAQVVFVYHFYLFNILPVKRMFLHRWHRKTLKVFLGLHVNYKCSR